MKFGASYCFYGCLSVHSREGDLSTGDLHLGIMPGGSSWGVCLQGAGGLHQGSVGQTTRKRKTDDTHPTGMLSCYVIFLDICKIVKWYRSTQTISENYKSD